MITHTLECPTDSYRAILGSSTGQFHIEYPDGIIMRGDRVRVTHNGSGLMCLVVALGPVSRGRVIVTLERLL